MTVVIEQPDEQNTDGVAEVAFAAGEATAHVEQLTEQVAEAEAVAEIAEGAAALAAEISQQAVSDAQMIIQQNTVIMEQNTAIMAGLQLLADAMSEPEPEPEPEPVKPPKKDTAPKRKSGTHRFLYGG